MYHSACTPWCLDRAQSLLYRLYRRGYPGHLEVPCSWHSLLASLHTVLEGGGEGRGGEGERGEVHHQQPAISGNHMTTNGFHLSLETTAPCCRNNKQGTNNSLRNLYQNCRANLWKGPSQGLTATYTNTRGGREDTRYLSVYHFGIRTLRMHTLKIDPLQFC